MEEIVEDAKKNPRIISVLLFGSFARGNANESSDIEIFYDNEYREFSAEKHGIKIDYNYWPNEKVLERVKKISVPFLPLYTKST